MTREDKLRLQRRFRRKLFWLFVAAAVAALLFTEQIAPLFVLSTLALCGFLMVVAFSNLEAKDAEMQASAGKEVHADTNFLELSKEERRAA